MPLMIRASSGLLGLDTFDRAAGTTIGNGWVEELGSWEISAGGTLVCTSSSGHGKVRWDSISATAMVVEIVARVPTASSGAHVGPSVMVKSDGSRYNMLAGASAPWYAIFELYGGAGFIATIAQQTSVALADNVYTRIRFEFQPDTIGGAGNRRLQAWVDNTLVLGPNFQSGLGHTGDADSPGIAVYNASNIEVSSVRVWKRSDLVVQGLTGSQGARLHASDGSVLAESGTQSGNVAYIPVGTLDMPITGYVQVYDDAGTWLAPVGTDQGGRYPESGSASDIYGGDVYEPPSLVSATVQVDWLNYLAADPIVWPLWDQTNADISARVKEIHIERGLANPRITVDTCELVLDDRDGRFVPTLTTGPMYPNVTVDRGVRILMAQGSTTTAVFFGYIAAIVPGMDDKPQYRTTFRIESPLRKLASIKISIPPISEGYAYNEDTDETLNRSALKTILDLAGQVEGGLAVAAVNREFTTSDDTITDWGGEEMTVGAALEELACRVGAMYWVQPQYRTLSGEPDWTLVWVPAGWKVGEDPDITWDTEAGDCDGLIPTFTLGVDK